MCTGRVRKAPILGNMSQIAQTVENEDSRIAKLPDDVVQRIAAGEIIHRPANALKEILENSIDANANSIQVISCKEGGLKFLQVQDDGHGINYLDLPILCHRHTTSKLSRYEDLSQIATFGFRGEALASISHCALLSVQTRRKQDPTGYRAFYIDGQLVSPKTFYEIGGSKVVAPGGSASLSGTESDCVNPVQCAATVGTTITIQNLFYNLPLRQKAFTTGAVSSISTREYSGILDIVQKYAIEFPSVKFSCRRIGSKNSMYDLHTSGNMHQAELTDALDGCLSVLRLIYGNRLTNELLKLEFDSDGSHDGQNGDHEKDFKPEETLPSVKIRGLVSNSTFTSKKTTFILFINHRLVESSTLKRSLQSIYANILPSKQHPFMFLSLQLPPERLDVNVHPTKREVCFLDEEKVIQLLCDKVFETVSGRKKLSQTESSDDLENNSRILTIPLNEPPSSMSSNLSMSSETRPMSMENAAVKIQKKTFDPLKYKLQPTLNPLSGFNNAANFIRPDIATVRYVGKSSSKPKPVPEWELVRTDHKTRKLESFPGFIKPKTNEISQKSIIDAPNVNNYPISKVEPQDDISAPIQPVPTDTSTSVKRKLDDDEVKNIQPENVESVENLAQKTLSQEKIEFGFTSIEELRSEIRQNAQSDLTQILKSHTFVGILDAEFALIQHDTKLILVNYFALSEDLFYEIVIEEFGNFGRLELDSDIEKPPSIHHLMTIAVTMCTSNGLQIADINLVNDYAQILIDNREMLEEYFNFSITEEGSLRGLPMLLPNYVPCKRKLPLFILRMALEVDYSDEKTCFSDIAREIALFYQIEIDPPEDTQEEEIESEDLLGKSKWKSEFRWKVEHVLFDAFRRMVVPSKRLDSETIVELAELSQLYKIFERC